MVDTLQFMYHFLIPTFELVMNLKCQCLCYKFLTTFYMSNEATFLELNTVNEFVSKIVYVIFFFFKCKNSFSSLSQHLKWTFTAFCGMMEILAFYFSVLCLQ